MKFVGSAITAGMACGGGISGAVVSEKIAFTDAADKIQRLADYHDIIEQVKAQLDPAVFEQLSEFTKAPSVYTPTDHMLAGIAGGVLVGLMGGVIGWVIADVVKGHHKDIQKKRNAAKALSGVTDILEDYSK